MSANVTIYTTTVCPYCIRAKQLLQRKDIEYVEVNLNTEPTEVREELMARNKQRTVPQIFINDEFIGGFDQLHALDRQGKLEQMIAGNS